MILIVDLVLVLVVVVVDRPPGQQLACHKYDMYIVQVSTCTLYMYIVHDCTAQIHVTIDLSKSRRKCRCDGLPSAWLGNWGLHGLRTTSALAEWLWACLRITRSRVRDPRWEQGACTVLANAVMHFFFFFFYYVHINNQLEKNKERQWYGD